tara:strand:- start:2409 stop:3005 length:597 start_codon:yes stop_codon:yes gene_type:complete
MIATEIELVGTYINHNTDHKNWWSEHLKGEAIANKIKKLNAAPLKEIYEKMYKDGIHYLSLHFEGGHDEGGFNDGFEYLDEHKKPLKVKPNLTKYNPDGWIEHWTPLEYTDPKTKIAQIFKYCVTSYDHKPLTEAWLQSAWYDFGFLEEWGSFAFEGHVYGDVIVSTKNGTYEVEASESVEQYENKSSKGSMFEEVAA